MTNRETMIAYLNLKVAAEDWHGVSDAANDLREMDAREGRVTDKIEAALSPVCNCAYCYAIRNGAQSLG